MIFPLEELARQYPDNPALVFKDKSYNFDQLNDKVISTAFFLNSRLQDSDNTIALIATNSDLWVIYALAVWRLGKCLVPINPYWNENELKSALEIADPDLIIYDKSGLFHEGIIDACASTIELKDVLDNKTFLSTYSPDPSLPALGIFTSGSTGDAKLVLHSWERLIKHAQMSEELLKYKNSNKWLISLPLFHIGGISTIIKMLVSGISVIISESGKIETIMEKLNNFRPDIMSLVPTQLSRLLNNYPDHKLPEWIDFILVGGGPLNMELLQQDKRLLGTYGMSEAGSQVATFKKNNDNKYLKLLTGVEIKIIDEENQICPDGIEGRIFIKSPALMLGYKDGDKINTNCIVDGWLDSGDYGSLDNNGHLFPVARREDRIISGGENISPFEIETILMQHHHITEAIVVPINNEEWGQVPGVAIIATDNVEIIEIKEYLSCKISSYKIPKKWVILEEIPMLANGKVDKNEISRLILKNGVELT